MNKQTVLVPKGFEINNPREIRSLKMTSDVVKDFDGYYFIKESVYVLTEQELNEHDREVAKNAIKQGCNIGMINLTSISIDGISLAPLFDTTKMVEDCASYLDTHHPLK